MLPWPKPAHGFSEGQCEKHTFVDFNIILLEFRDHLKTRNLDFLEHHFKKLKIN